MTATRDQQAALLAAIRAEPEEDMLRLVFADWLEEQGDPRAEFIRLQCSLASMAQDDPRWQELERREEELLRQHGETWKGNPPQKVEVSFLRGLLSVQVEAELLAEDAVSQWFLAHQGWVTELQLDDAEDESLGRVASRGLLAQVALLWLSAAEDS